MEHAIADSRGPAVIAIGFPGAQHADRIRFVAGLAITCGGAAAFLSDLIARVGTWV